LGQFDCALRSAGLPVNRGEYPNDGYGNCPCDNQVQDARACARCLHEKCGGNSGRETFQLASSISPSLPEVIGHGEARNKFCNYFEDSLIDIVLRFVPDVFFSDEQRMISAFDNMQKIRRDHFLANAFE